MEVDELLAKLNDENFRYFRAFLKQKGALQRPDKTTHFLTNDNILVAEDDDHVEAANGEKKTKRPNKRGASSVVRIEIEPPTYADTAAVVETLTSDVTEGSARLAAAERRRLVAPEAELAATLKETDEAAKRLSMSLMQLSNVLAFDVITTRTLPEMQHKEAKERMAILLDKRARLMRESEQEGVAATKQRIPEIIDLFRDAAEIAEVAKQAWPDRYDYIVVTPPETRKREKNAAPPPTSPSPSSKPRRDRKPSISKAERSPASKTPKPKNKNTRV